MSCPGGKAQTTLRPGVAERLQAEIVTGATAIGLSGDRFADRLTIGAANAWEERDWVCSDFLVLAGRQRLDLRDPDQGRRLAEELQGFYDKAARLIDHAVTHEAALENDRLGRTLRAMGRIMQSDGKVEFRGDAHAQRFAAELRARYGDGVVAEFAHGRTDALARDVADEAERKWVARAVVSAAKSHVALGLTLRQARDAERMLASPSARNERDWERKLGSWKAHAGLRRDFSKCRNTRGNSGSTRTPHRNGSSLRRCRGRRAADTGRRGGHIDRCQGQRTGGVRGKSSSAG
jgi:type IV secretion system T-DNA border endonuclease VirD2